MNILIVEDELIEQQALTKMLTRLYPDLHATILYATDGVEAVGMAQTHDIAILFMDIQLPLKNGLQAAQEIREFNSHALLVMVTAYSEFEYARKALQNDTFDYLVKPYSVKTFQRMMDKLLHKLGDIQTQKQHLKQFGKLQELLQREFMQKLLLGQSLSPQKAHAYISSLSLESKVYQCCLWVCKDHPDELVTAKFDHFLSDQGITYMRETFQAVHYILLVSNSLDILKPLAFQLNQRRLFVQEGSFLFSPLMTDWHTLGEEFQQLLIKLPNKPLETPSPELTVLSLADAILSNAPETLNKETDLLLAQIYQLHTTRPEFQSKLFEHFLQVIKQVYSVGDVQASLIYSQIGCEFALKTSPGEREIGEEFKLAIRQFRTYYLANVQTQNERLILQVKQYIHKHFALPLGLDELAKEVQMSTSYLSRTFKNLEGMNIKDYILNVKLDHAKQFLLSGMSVDATSSEIGFSDPSYFSKCFKREIGLTPRQFVQERRQI